MTFRGYVRLYPITVGLIAINLLLYFFAELQGGHYDRELQYRYGFLQTNVDPYVLEEWWRYVTSVFLHFDFEHLFYNMVSLLMFAPPMERLLGRWRYTLLYMLAGIVGNLFSAMFNQIELLSVGASGAIYGVYGAWLYLTVFGRNMLDKGMRQSVYFVLIIGLVYSFLVANVNVEAHIGGLVAGFVFLGAMHWMRKSKR